MKCHLVKRSFVMYLLVLPGADMYAQTASDSVYKLAKSYVDSGTRCYIRGDGDCAVRAFLQAHDLFLRNNNAKDRVLCLHNLAFTYDEVLHNDKQALAYTEQSIAMHQQDKDTLEMANMYKYAGMLKGRLGMYSMAKADIARATGLFRQKEFSYGVAVCMFDLALVYINEQKTDSALHYLEKAKQYWIGVNNPARIFGINSVLMDVWYRRDQKEKCREVIRENEELLAGGLVYFRDRLDFYSRAATYRFADPGYPNTVYDERYRQLADSLESMGIKTGR